MTVHTAASWFPKRVWRAGVCTCSMSLRLAGPRVAGLMGQGDECHLASPATLRSAFQIHLRSGRGIRTGLGVLGWKPLLEAGHGYSSHSEKMSGKYCSAQPRESLRGEALCLGGLAAAPQTPSSQHSCTHMGTGAACRGGGCGSHRSPGGSSGLLGPAAESRCAVCWRTLVLKPERLVELPVQPLTGHQPRVYSGSFLHGCW